MSQSIWQNLADIFRSKAHKLAEEVEDKNSIVILEQKLRDASADIDAAKRELGNLMAKHKVTADEVTALKATISDYESKGIAALQAGNEELALKVADKVSLLEGEHILKAAASEEYRTGIETMRSDIRRGEANIAALRQMTDRAKAKEAVQKARISSSLASGQANAHLETAASTMKRLTQRQLEKDASIHAHEQLASESSGADLDRQLRDAGIGPDTNNTSSVLERMKAKALATA